MLKRRRFIEKLSDRTVILGLSSLAVLLALGDAAVKLVLSFPDHWTGIGRVWDQVIQRQPKTIKEYFEEAKEISGYNLGVILRRLEKKGLVKKTSRGLHLTPTGIILSKRIKEKINHFADWDGKWRLVTFDIPERLRKERDWLRAILTEYDYKPLHKSVFLGKFPLPREVYRSLYDRKLSDHVRLLTVSGIDKETYPPRS